MKSLADVKGKEDPRTPQLGNTQEWRSSLVADQGWKVDAQSGKGDVRSFRTTTDHPGRLQVRSIDGAWVPEPTASKLVAEGGRRSSTSRRCWHRQEVRDHDIIVRRELPQ